MKPLIRNMFLLILLGYSLTVLPLNPELFQLDLSRYSYENTIQNQDRLNAITYAYTLSGTPGTLVNPDVSEFHIKAVAGKKPVWKAMPELTLQILKDGNILRTLKPSEFSEMLVPSDGINPWELVYRLHLNRDHLALDGTGYVFRIFSSSDALKGLKPLDVSVQYMTALKYRTAVDSAPDGKQMVRLFFPDASKKFVVPVSRIVPRSGKVFRHLSTQLGVLPPVELGLSQDNLMPKLSSIRWSSGLVTCQLKNAPIALTTSPDLVALIQKSLLESITATETTFQINKVQLRLGDPQPLTGWNSEPFTITPGPIAWMALENGKGSALLIPKRLATDGTVTAESLMQLLKQGQGSLLPTVPDHVQLLDNHIEGNTLVLNFGQNLQAVFAGSPDLAALFLDSIANSFTTLEGVDSIRIEAANTPIATLGTIPVPNPMIPKIYVNPEVAPVTTPAPQ